MHNPTVSSYFVDLSFFVNLFFRYKSVRCTFENRQDTGSAAQIWLRLDDSLQREDSLTRFNAKTR